MNAPLIFLPEHQKAAALELHTELSKAMQKFTNGVTQINEQTLDAMRRAIAEVVQAWLRKYPKLTKLSIDFDLKTDAQNGKITILPSYDFQRLLAGAIVI